MSEHERQYIIDEIARSTMNSRKRWYSAGIITILLSTGGIIFSIGSWEGTEAAFRKDTVRWQQEYKPIIDNCNIYVVSHQNVENTVKRKRIDAIQVTE